MNAAGDAKFTGEVRFNDRWLDQPLRWRKPRMIFVCAHGDLFHENVPDEWIDRVFAVMALAPQHTFQVLTKRPDRARAYLNSGCELSIGQEAFAMLPKSKRPEDYLMAFGNEEEPNIMTKAWPLRNVWLGTSVEDQSAADARIPHLLATPAAVRFVSAEPLLGRMDIAWALGRPITLAAGILARGRFAPGLETLRALDWVIVGGESGPHARPMHPEWARSLRDQCSAAGVPFFFKQWGEWVVPYDGDPACRVCGCTMNWACEERCWWVEPDLCSSCIGKPSPKERAVKFYRAGKRAAGRLLDGRDWSQMP